MKQNAYRLRPVAAAVLAVLAVLVAGQPAVAAPRRDRQWHLDYLKIGAVHRVSTGTGVVVAVVDSGVDAGHPDLAGRVLPGARSDGGSGDGRSDRDSHGTHMAGIIAATNRGADGVLGVAPGAKILPIKAKAGDGEYPAGAIARGIRLAADMGAKVINVSVAGFGSGEETEAVKYALSKDVVVVAGAGNRDQWHLEIMAPANVPGVIAVTGLDQRGSFWSGSAQGPEAVVAAPAEEILNVGSRDVMRSGYSIGNGTSDATAIVSGVAALIRSRYPELDAANVINRIIRTADDAGPAGRDPQYGFGRVDALQALTADVPRVSANPLTGEKATHSAAPPGAGDDEPFDVTRYGDRSGLNDQQVMVIAIVVGVLLLLLVLAVLWLLVRWRRNRSASAAPLSVPVDSHGSPVGYGGPPAGPGAPPGGHGGAPGDPRR